MPERIAIKLLSGSDLTFFDTFFKRSNIGNQKAINLNADVFAKQFYPDFAERSLGENVEIPVSVTVFGPRPGKAYKFARSITKKTGYKNWRLNGAAVPDPDNEAGRFDHLQVDDLAVLEFTGDAIPEAVRIIIVSARDDPEFHARLRAEVPGGKKSMIAVSRAHLTELASLESVGPKHPIRALLADPELDELLEQASLGTEPAVRRLREKTGRPLTKSDLATARAKAERIGDDGEALALQLLNHLASEGILPPVTWTAADDAAASWDFETMSGAPIRFDAKATSRKFETPFHLSGAETVAAASTEVPYRIIRLYELTEDGAMARISHDINALAREIIAATSHLPRGILPGGFTVAPSVLTWEEPVRIERPDEPD